MHINISRTKLTQSLGKLARVGDGRSPHPCVGKLLLQASRKTEEEPATLRLYATDLNLQIEQALDAVVIEEGAVGVDSKRFLACVKAFDAPQLWIEIKGDRLVISAGGTRKFVLPMVKAELFPAQVMPGDTDPSVSLPSAVLRRLIERVRGSIDPGTSDTPNRNGVMIDISSGMIRAIALGNFLWSVAEEQLNVDDFSIFLPSSALRTLDAVMEENETVKIIGSASRIFCETEDTLCGDAIPAQPYPPWRNFFESMGGTLICRVASPLLIDAVKSVIVARSSVSQVVQVEFDRKTCLMTIKLLRDDSEAEDKIQATPAGRHSFSCVVSPEWLLAAAAAAGEEVTVEVGTTNFLHVFGEGFRGYMARSQDPDVPDYLTETDGELPEPPAPDSPPEDRQLAIPGTDPGPSTPAPDAGKRKPRKSRAKKGEEASSESGETDPSL